MVSILGAPTCGETNWTIRGARALTFTLYAVESVMSDKQNIGGN
jgi:hypothetical protein